jgi:hypothetical protein
MHTVADLGTSSRPSLPPSLFLFSYSPYLLPPSRPTPLLRTRHRSLLA